MGLYVEVEGKYHRECGHRGVRAPSARTTPVEDCRASGVAGIATDFQRLYYHPTAELWVKAWATSTVLTPCMDYLLRRLVGPPPNTA